MSARAQQNIAADNSVPAIFLKRKQQLEMVSWKLFESEFY